MHVTNILYMINETCLAVIVYQGNILTLTQCRFCKPLLQTTCNTGKNCLNFSTLALTISAILLAPALSLKVLASLYKILHTEST